jgi:large subunit ribosomal protein L9
VGDGDKMFGSVTAQQIYAHLKKDGFDNISKKSILLETPIKTLGIYNIPVKLESGVTGTVKVWVVKE